MKIFAKTMDNKTIELAVEGTQTIRQVKEQIQALEQVRAEQQVLMIAGQNLDDARTLNSYDVQENSILHLVFRVKDDSWCSTF